MIKVKSWGQMVDEYGTDSDGDIDGPGAVFAVGMKRYCGKEYYSLEQLNAEVFEWKFLPYMVESSDWKPATGELVQVKDDVDEGWFHDPFKYLATLDGKHYFVSNIDSKIPLQWDQYRRIEKEPCHNWIVKNGDDEGYVVRMDFTESYIKEHYDWYQKIVEEGDG